MASHFCVHNPSTSIVWTMHGSILEFRWYPQNVHMGYSFGAIWRCLTLHGCHIFSKKYGWCSSYAMVVSAFINIIPLQSHVYVLYVAMLCYHFFLFFLKETDAFSYHHGCTSCSSLKRVVWCCFKMAC